MTFRTNNSFNPEPTDIDIDNLSFPGGGNTGNTGGTSGTNGTSGTGRTGETNGGRQDPVDEADEAEKAEENRVFDLMMQMIEDHGQNDAVQGYHAWMTVGHLENMGHWAKELGDLPPEKMNEMVSGLLDFATKFADDQEGYILASALLSTLGQAMQANPKMAENLSQETRQRLTNLAEMLDVAAPGQLNELLELADNLENFQRSGNKTLDDWNNQKNGGDIDFNKGAFGDAATALEALEAVMGDQFIPPPPRPERVEDIKEEGNNLQDIISDVPPEKQSDLDALFAELSTDPIFALILALLATAEDDQKMLGDMLADSTLEMDEQTLAAVQHKLHKVNKIIEMAFGLKETKEEMDDAAFRGF